MKRLVITLALAILALGALTTRTNVSAQPDPAAPHLPATVHVYHDAHGQPFLDPAELGRTPGMTSCLVAPLHAPGAAASTAPACPAHLTPPARAALSRAPLQTQPACYTYSSGAIGGCAQVYGGIYLQYDSYGNVVCVYGSATLDGGSPNTLNWLSISIQSYLMPYWTPYTGGSTPTAYGAYGQQQRSTGCYYGRHALSWWMSTSGTTATPASTSPTYVYTAGQANWYQP